MYSNRPMDSKREEFRKYLERNGVMDAVTRILANLYDIPEKPGDALAFFYKSLAEDRPEKFDFIDNSKELEQERAKVEALTKELAEAKAKIEAMEKQLSERNQPSEEIESTEKAPETSSPPEEPKPPEVPPSEEAVDSTA